MKLFKLFLPIVSWGLLVSSPNVLHAAEENNGLVVIDRKPWKTSWFEEDGYWILSTMFEKGQLKTYFKKSPPRKGLGVDSSNKPLKQEFYYYPTGKTYVSKKSQYEQWPDGAKAWAFSYDDKIRSEKGPLYRKCTTAIIEEVGNEPDEIRYALMLGSD